LKSGARVVTIQMPPGARAAGRYTVRWSAGVAPDVVMRSFPLQVVAGRPSPPRGSAKRPVEILVAGKPSLAAGIRGTLNVSALRVSATDVDGAFELSASSTRNVRVVVVDTRIYGLQLVRDLRAVFPELRIVAIATDPKLTGRALRAGADTALPPSATAGEVARAAAGGHEALELRQVLVEAVAEPLELLDPLLVDPKPAVADAVRHGQVRTDVEELVLDPLERRAHLVRDSLREHDADLRVQLVD